MQESYNNNIAPTNSVQSNAPTIVQTDVGAKDGQNKCPKCGYSENASCVYPNNVFRRIDEIK